MKFQELLLILIGAIAFIWAIVTLNDFIGGSGFLTYVGTPVAIGLFVIFIGALIWVFVADYVGA